MSDLVPQLSDSEAEDDWTQGGAEELVYYLEGEEEPSEEPSETSSIKARSDATLKEDFLFLETAGDTVSKSEQKNTLGKPCPETTRDVQKRFEKETSGSSTIKFCRTPPHENLEGEESESTTFYGDPFSELKMKLSGMESCVSRLQRQSMTYDSPQSDNFQVTPHATPTRDTSLMQNLSRRKRKRNSIIKSDSQTKHRPTIWKNEREFKRLTKEHTQRNTNSPIIAETEADRVKRRRLSEVRFSPHVKSKIMTTPVAPRQLSDLKIENYSKLSPVSPFVPKYSLLLVKDSTHSNAGGT